MSPIGTALRRTGLSPDHLTAIGLVMALPAALAIARGWLIAGLALVIASALPDLLDGALAKASGRASARGAFFDSVADRVSDALVLGGIAWYLQARHHGQAAMLPFAVLAASMLISYERAKAESLGFSAKGGLMERAERIILVCIGLAFSVVLVPILWVMLTLAVITAIQRFVKVWHQATRRDREPDSPTVAPMAMAERWRAWRQANGWGSEALGSNHFARGSQRASRWQERRRARLQRLQQSEAGDPTDGSRARPRRSDARRP